MPALAARAAASLLPLALLLAHDITSVSEVTDDGYLRLRRTGTAGHPLSDQVPERGPAAPLWRRRPARRQTAVADGAVTSRETIFLLTTQRIFGWAGLSTALVAPLPISALAVVDSGNDTRTAQAVNRSGLVLGTSASRSHKVAEPRRA